MAGASATGGVTEAELARMGDELCELAGHLAAGEAEFLVKLAEFDRRRAWGSAGCRSCAHWLGWKLGMGRSTALEKLRVAHALEDLPGITAAFLAGELTYCKVRVLTRVATPATEAGLAEQAKHATGAHLANLLRGYRHSKRQVSPAGDTSAEEDLPEFSCTAFVDDDGFVVGSFRLPAAEGAVVLEALETGPAGDTRAVDERRAEALVAMAEAALTVGSTSRSPWLVTLHVTDRVLAGEDPDGAAWLADGTPLDTGTTLRMCCDSAVERMAWGARSTPTDLGRRARVVPPRLRRALEARDGGCRFPGCTATRHLRAHHIVHWAHGGATALPNLLLLCPQHHWLVHEGGFDLRGNADIGITFYDQRGMPLDPDSVRLHPTETSRLRRRHERRGLRITPRTAACRWTGEPCDYDTWITTLLAQERADAARAAA